MKSRGEAKRHRQEEAREQDTTRLEGVKFEQSDSIESKAQRKNVAQHPLFRIPLYGREYSGKAEESDMPVGEPKGEESMGRVSSEPQFVLGLL